MERNDGNDLGVNGQGDSNEFSGSGPSQQDTSFDFSGSAGVADQHQGIRDRARNAMDNAGDRLTDVGSSLREKAGSARNKLVGALDAGADRLRERSAQGGVAVASSGAGTELAGATGDASVSFAGDGRAVQVTDRVAGGMQATADWLRDADVEGLKTGIERQVKEHPGRTLLIAAGLGYLLGRAFRK